MPSTNEGSHSDTTDQGALKRSKLSYQGLRSLAHGLRSIATKDFWSSYPRPGTNTQATRKFSIPQPSAALDGSTHDMKAVNDQGLRLSAETPVSAIHSATSNNGDTSHTSHDKDPNLERASLGRMWDEGRAFPKKPLHKATQELVPGLKQYNPPSTSVSVIPSSDSRHLNHGSYGSKAQETLQKGE